MIDNIILEEIKEQLIKKGINGISLNVSCYDFLNNKALYELKIYASILNIPHISIQYINTTIIINTFKSCKKFSIYNETAIEDAVQYVIKIINKCSSLTQGETQALTQGEIQDGR